MSEFVFPCEHLEVTLFNGKKVILTPKLIEAPSHSPVLGIAVYDDKRKRIGQLIFELSENLKRAE